jgi:hypothetical protein
MNFQVPYPALTVPATRLREAASFCVDALNAGVASGVEAAEALGLFVAQAYVARDHMLPEATWEPCDNRFIEAWRHGRDPGLRADQKLRALVGHYVEDCKDGAKGRRAAMKQPRLRVWGRPDEVPLWSRAVEVRSREALLPTPGKRRTSPTAGLSIG